MKDDSLALTHENTAVGDDQNPEVGVKFPELCIDDVINDPPPRMTLGKVSPMYPVLHCSAWCAAVTLKFPVDGIPLPLVLRVKVVTTASSSVTLHTGHTYQNPHTPLTHENKCRLFGKIGLPVCLFQFYALVHFPYIKRCLPENDSKWY